MSPTFDRIEHIVAGTLRHDQIQPHSRMPMLMCVCVCALLARLGEKIESALCARMCSHISRARTCNTHQWNGQALMLYMAAWSNHRLKCIHARVKKTRPNNQHTGSLHTHFNRSQSSQLVLVFQQSASSTHAQRGVKTSRLSCQRRKTLHTRG